METASEYISRLKERNRKLFTAQKIQIEPLEIERLLLEAWRHGHRAGVEAKSLFEQIFGRKG